MRRQVDIEEVFSSKGSTLIVKILAEKEELNISALCRTTGLNYPYPLINKCVKRFVEYGLIKERRFDRIRILEFNEENKYSVIIKDFIRKWRIAQIDAENKDDRCL